VFNAAPATQIIVPVGAKQSYIEAGIAAGDTNQEYGGLTIVEA